MRSRKIDALRMITLVSAAAMIGCGQQTNFDTSNQATSNNLRLQSHGLTYATTVNIPVNIAKSDILAAVTAPSGDSLTLVSVSQPPSGATLTDNGTQFSFVAPAAGTITLHYIVSDSNNLQTTSNIVVTVVPSGNAVASYYAVAGGNLYELSANNQQILSTVPTTYQGQSITFDDLAINSAGEMYAKDYSNNGIYRVNVATGVSTQIVSTVPNSSGYLEGLTFLPDGTLATVQTDGTILSFNISTLQTVVYLSTNYSMAGGDIKALPDGNIYWTVANGSTSLCASYSGVGTQTLVRINPGTKGITEVGCLGQPNIYGLGFAHNTVYGFTNAGQVVTISTTNAQTTVVANPGFQFWGAGSNPLLW